jgi:hypothetical protein
MAIKCNNSNTIKNHNNKNQNITILALSYTYIRTFKINLMVWEVYKRLCCWTNVWYLGRARVCLQEHLCSSQGAVATKQPQNFPTSENFPLASAKLYCQGQQCVCGLFPLCSSATPCRTCIMHCKSKLRRRNWQWDTADCRLSVGWHCPPLERTEFDWRAAEVSEIGTPTRVRGQTGGPYSTARLSEIPHNYKSLSHTHFQT